MIKECQKCKGKGYYETRVADRRNTRQSGFGMSAIIPCDVVGCDNGTVDTVVQHRVLWGPKGVI